MQLIIMPRLLYQTIAIILFCARFAEVAEAEVVEGDVGEEVDSVEIRSEEYNGEGEKM